MSTKINHQAVARVVAALASSRFSAYANTSFVTAQVHDRSKGASSHLADTIQKLYWREAGLDAHWRRQLVVLTTGLGVPNDGRFEEGATALRYNPAGFPGNWLTDQVVVTQESGQFHFLYPTDTTRDFDTVDDAAAEFLRLYQQAVAF